MQVIKAIYKHGNIKFLEKPDINKETDILIIFPDNDNKKESNNANNFVGEELLQLCGIISVGGDAVEDSEKLYE